VWISKKVGGGWPANNHPPLAPALGFEPRTIANRLREHGLPDETEHSIKAKLKRGTFPATFFLATLAALGRESVGLADI